MEKLCPGNSLPEKSVDTAVMRQEAQISWERILTMIRMEDEELPEMAQEVK